MSGDMKVTKVTSLDQASDLPRGLSFYDPLLRHEIKESLESEGVVFISENSLGKKDGLFIYDKHEATGTIFTKSKEVFDHFFNLEPSSYIFSELDIAGLPKEDWNIWRLDIDSVPASFLKHKFKHHVSIDYDVKELEEFMASSQPETNRKWISIALSNGDKAFVARISNRIVGIAWMSIADGVARSHGVYVEPRFRRMGITTDIFQARLHYLKSRHVHILVNEIAESNRASSGHAAKIGEKIVGKIYLYASPERKSVVEE